MIAVVTSPQDGWKWPSIPSQSNRRLLYRALSNHPRATLRRQLTLRKARYCTKEQVDDDPANLVDGKGLGLEQLLPCWRLSSHFTGVKSHLISPCCQPSLSKSSFL